MSALFKGGGPPLGGGGLVKCRRFGQPLANPPPCYAWSPSLHAGRTSVEEASLRQAPTFYAEDYRRCRPQAIGITAATSNRLPLRGAVSEAD